MTGPGQTGPGQTGPRAVRSTGPRSEGLPAAALGSGGTAGDGRFEALLAEATAGAGHFGHREHVRLTWLAVRRYGVEGAVDVVGAGIQRTARYAGVPQKYHVTMSRAWVLLIGLHAVEGDEDFDGFVARCPALLDKRLLARHYSSTALASRAARTGWVEPDLQPLPL